MTDWPKMESMVMVSDGYFASEEFKERSESRQKEMFDRVHGTPVKIVDLMLYGDNTKRCGVVVDERIFEVPLEYVEPVIIDKPEDDGEQASEEIRPAKAVAAEKTPVTVTFPFTDDSRMGDALLFFVRNGYKVWVEDTCHGPMYLREGKLNVEMPKGRS